MTGGAYVCEHSEGVWGENDELALDDGAGDDEFGFSVSIQGGRALIGSPGRDVITVDNVTLANAGQGFTYGYKDGVWKRDTANAQQGTGALAGDNVGYAVAIDGNNALLGAPQVDPRTDGDIDIDGTGYGYIWSKSPPQSVTVPVLQETLIKGAQANKLTGTLGDYQTSDLYFFDIASVTP